MHKRSTVVKRSELTHTPSSRCPGIHLNRLTALKNIYFLVELNLLHRMREPTNSRVTTSRPSRSNSVTIPQNRKIVFLYTFTFKALKTSLRNTTSYSITILVFSRSRSRIFMWHDVLPHAPFGHQARRPLCWSHVSNFIFFSCIRMVFSISRIFLSGRHFVWYVRPSRIFVDRKKIFTRVYISLWWEMLGK